MRSMDGGTGRNFKVIERGATSLGRPVPSPSRAFICDSLEALWFRYSLWGLFLRLVMCRFLSRQAGWRPVDRPSRRGMFRIAAWLGPTDCPRFHIMFYSYAPPPSLSNYACRCFSYFVLSMSRKGGGKRLFGLMMHYATRLSFPC